MDGVPDLGERVWEDNCWNHIVERITTDITHIYMHEQESITITVEFHFKPQCTENSITELSDLVFDI